MLQQTTVGVALSYFERWMAAFPTVRSLAEATEEQVLGLWQGLGYYNRCRNLLHGAQIVLDSGMPCTESGWRALPGIGPYTAAALASICNGEATAVVDGNVARVFARQCACDKTGDRLRKSARAWAQQYIDLANPADFNQALMELGATVCKPGVPSCLECPVSGTCVALMEKREREFPRKNPRPETVKLNLSVEIPVCGDLLGIRPISWGSWWRGMWEFPTSLLNQESSEPKLGRFEHNVTHYKLTFSVDVKDSSEPDKSLRWVSSDQIKGIAMPSPMRKALKLAQDTGSLTAESGS